MTSRDLHGRLGSTADGIPPPFPTFMILGAPHSGSRELCRLLARVPDVHVPETDSRFFSRDYEEGGRRYLERFADAGEATHVGDRSMAYLGYRDDREVIAARIDGFLPDVRIVAVLRDPVERTCAEFTQLIVRGEIAPETDVADYLSDLDEDSPHRSLIEASLYGHNLLPYVDRFGERLLVVDHRDVVESAAATTAGVAAHVGFHVTADPTTADDAVGRAPDPTPSNRVRERLEPHLRQDRKLLREVAGISFGSDSRA